MEGCMFRLQILWRNRTTRLVMLTVLAFFFIIEYRNLLLSSDSLSLSYFVGPPVPVKENLPNSTSSSSVEKESFLSDNTRNIIAEIPDIISSERGGGGGNRTEKPVSGADDDDAVLEEDMHPDEEFVFDIGNGTALKKDKDGHIVVEQLCGDGERDCLEKNLEQLLNSSSSSVSDNADDSSLSPSEPGSSVASPTHSPPLPSPPNESETRKKVSGEENAQASQNVLPTSNSTVADDPVLKEEEEEEEEKQQQRILGVPSISDMDRELAESRASARSMIPLWPSKVDREILYAKEQIEKAPIVTDDGEELYAPVFRNFSRFKRSYELMEKILKVYVYKEGERPIFHKPLLTGIYASEGWFMKQMEANRKFVVSDPSRAHLFYMPFSSRILQQVLYVADSHSHNNLIEHLKKYVRTISTAYRFWNRTGGADHFLAGCHDRATQETGRSMETAIRALCNADVREGFQIGKDVSLPETNVGNGRDPLRNLGGKPSHARTTLAFFAGKMHGYLRPLLLQLWEKKHPDMLISGPIRHRARTKKKRRNKITRQPYVEYMKDSKYCICPRGYEVNSPRVVEAIIHGCVPVIISDNFVPPFFELLDWSAFSVILPENDLPRLREVLLGIGPRRYAELERGVRGVRRHFLWNRRALKYDLFHMILHNVWFNRLYQLQIH